jgi:hypothetical protein
MYRWLLLAALACLPTTANGGFISRDWKTPGDGLLTYDNVNQREWLDLTESRLSMFPGSTFEQRYQNALLELAPGEKFEGFIVAKGPDLSALAQSAGINVLTYDFDLNAIPTTQLINLVGVSPGSPTTTELRSFGLLDEVGTLGQSSKLYQKVGYLRVAPDSGANVPAGLIIYPGTFDGVARADNTGVWLYRPVPEPSGFLLVVFSMYTFVKIKKKPIQI